MEPLLSNIRPRRLRRGFVLITSVLSMVTLLAFLGLAVDVGYLYLVKMKMQTAADAAALGGVQAISISGAAGAPVAARSDAAGNGFTNGQNGVTVTVNVPPASGFYTASPTAVEVTITQSIPAFFMELVGTSSSMVRARAVARAGNGASCLYVMDPAASAAFSATGGVVVQINCGIVVNSSSATAMKVSGGSTVTATSVQIVGDYSATGGGTISPVPQTNVAARPDPLSYVAAPAVGGCDHTNFSISSTTTIDHGVYCGGIKISGGATVTFREGTYILEGGGLSVSGNSTISGTGVTFYNTAGGGYSYKAIDIPGGTVMNLAAPTTGDLAGILFFQDRAISGGAGSSIVGNSSAVITGALYFPSTALKYAGGTGATSVYTIIVAKTIDFTGGSVVKNDYTSLPGGSPIRGNAELSE
jgi:hypothetical protein